MRNAKCQGRGLIDQLACALYFGVARHLSSTDDRRRSVVPASGTVSRPAAVDGVCAAGSTGAVGISPTLPSTIASRLWSAVGESMGTRASPNRLARATG